MVIQLSAARAATTQPSFDFLTGGETTNAHPLRERVVSSENEKGGANGEHDRVVSDLKAEIKTLKYTLSTRDQEQELAKLRQESEIRDVRRKGDEDFKKMQAAEGERNKAVRQYEALMKELQEVKDRAANEKAALEKRLRDAEEGKRADIEEVEDGKAELEERLRAMERGRVDLESRNTTLQSSLDDLREEGEAKDHALHETQQRLLQREAEIGELESEVLRLKAQTGDVDTLGVIKRELSEQVAHIRTLEATNREQLAELKHFRRLHKSIEVVEEEKRELQRRVDSIDDLQQELGEARLQRQRLEDERLAWTAYLESQAGEDGQAEFDSPEAIARALVRERLEAAALLEKIGGLEPALAEKEEIIKNLEAEKAKLESQVKKLKPSGGGDDKSRSRLERRLALALKEIEYLRAQLKTFDAEESTMELSSFDEQKATRIQQLEDMVDVIERKPILKCRARQRQTGTPPSEVAGIKRAREEPENQEHLGQLSRKNRKLQDELSAAQTSASLLQKELAVAQERLTALTSPSDKPRILSLRSNPTSDVEAIKMATLAALKAENAALLSQLRTGNPNTAVVPVATLEAAQRDVRDMAKTVADKEKQMSRLKQIWGAKSMEFREGVNSLLGWKVDFLPSGKMKVSSLFYPSTEDSENSIVFDGENGIYPFLFQLSFSICALLKP